MAQEAAPEDDMMAADRVMAVGNWYGKWTNVNIRFNFFNALIHLNRAWV